MNDIESTLAAIAVVLFAMLITYGGYILGKGVGRYEVASGEIKMFLIEFKDGTREWYCEKDMDVLDGEFTIVS